MIAEWLAAQAKSQCDVQISVSCASRGQVKWQPPDSGWHKVNVDAAIHEGSSFLKIGMVLRNGKGDSMTGIHRSINEEVSILEEATWVQEALYWISGLGTRNVIVEYDSLTVINALLKNTSYVSEVGTTFECFRSILGDQLSDLKVQ